MGSRVLVQRSQRQAAAANASKESDATPTPLSNLDPVLAAAIWLRDRPPPAPNERRRPAIPELRDRFGLRAPQAVIAIQLAEVLRRHATGTPA